MSVRYHKSRGSNEGWLTSYADLITNLLIFFVLIISASAIQTGKMEQIVESLSSQTSPKSLSAAEKELQAELAKQNLTDRVRVELSNEGLALSFDSGVIFQSGSAELNPEVSGPLDQVLKILLPYKNRYHYAIEGHTDERPISTQVFKSNWELSSERAMRIRERLETLGVPGQKIRVEAYADGKPLEKKLLVGLTPEQQLAKHRRVVIRLF